MQYKIWEKRAIEIIQTIYQKDKRIRGKYLIFIDNDNYSTDFKDSDYVSKLNIPPYEVYFIFNLNTVCLLEDLELIFIKNDYSSVPPWLNRVKLFNTFQTKNYWTYLIDANWKEIDGCNGDITSLVVELKRKRAKFNFYTPISVPIGIKSQKKFEMTLYPRNPQDSKYTTLQFKYGDDLGGKLNFLFKKGNTALALIALFIYTCKNTNKAVVLTAIDIRDTLKSSGVIKNKKEFNPSNIKRLKRQFYEKIGSNKTIPSKIKTHLRKIFPQTGKEFRLETSIS